MPVSPELAETLAKELLDTYTQAETEMLRTVARRLERGITDPGWAETKLAQTTVMRQELEQVVRDVGQQTPEQVERAVTRAYTRGAAAAGTDLVATGRVAGAFTGVGDGAAIRTLAREAHGTLSGVGIQALRSSEDAYRSIVFEASRGVSVGTQTRLGAAQKALNRFAEQGITGFVDSAGRNWDMASYTEMAVRTTTGRAAIAGHADKLAAEGLDLVQVSDAPEECPICRPWEGRVLSLKGRTQDRPTLADAEAAGLFHPNCRHSIGLYDSRVSKKPKRTADPEGNLERQKQRYLERQVRTWKRREAVALSPSEAKKARSKVRAWQGSLKTFVDRNNRKRLRHREQITATTRSRPQADLLQTNRERLAGLNRPGIDDVPEIRTAAARKFDEALTKEADISAVLGDVQQKTGATFQHYGERVKYESSIRDKIFREMQSTPGLTPAQAADRITDTNRYTMMWEADDAYRAKQASAVRAMNDAGWETIADKNAWGPGGTYNGMNYKFKRGDDIVELQFHTPQSAVIKDESHILYSQARTMDPGPEKEALGQRILDLWNSDRSHIPPNMEDVGTPTFYGLDL